MSRFVVFLLVLILPLQALSVGRRLTHAHDHLPEHLLEHLLEHAQHIPHHHEDDGAVHHDKGDESIAHQFDFDYGTSLSAMLSAPIAPEASRHSQIEPDFLTAVFPHPFFRPPHPPPRIAP
ncbi:hypothetical protein [Cupriavidus sp. TA19]|uniref:hypothetical protein n=1 Tax=Cupriavidus sp. TA19 TaxID=701108 RepID=UPI00295F31DB|nr:hypothetical protein [Cupriavidus sp. TA19]